MKKEKVKAGYIRANNIREGAVIRKDEILFASSAGPKGYFEK